MTIPVPQPPDDLTLLRAVAGRDKVGFQILYERHSPMLFALALKILGDRTDAEDVLQETFLQIWKTAPTYDERRGKPLGWLIMLTRSRAIDRLRSRQTRVRITETAGIETQPGMLMPGDEVMAGESAAAVRLALGELPAEQRVPIELAYFGGLTQTQIARQLGQPLGTVKTRMRAGLMRLRDGLAARPREEFAS